MYNIGQFDQYAEISFLLKGNFSICDKTVKKLTIMTSTFQFPLETESSLFSSDSR
jgi:hypothetical protein